MRLIASFLAASLLAGPALAQNTALTDSATSRVEVGRGGEIFTFHTVNTTFEWLGIWRQDREGYQHLILKKTVEGTVSNGAEGTLGAKVRLEVSEVASDGLKPLYVIEDAGEAGYVESFAWNAVYFTTVRYGCCGALDTLHTYSLDSARQLFTATAPVAWFEVPNAGGLVRLAAIHTIFSTEDDVIFAGYDNALAQVTFASPSEPLQRFVISANGQLSGDLLEYPDPFLGWAEGDSPPVPDLEVWSFDGNRDVTAINTVSLLVQVAPELVVRLPLVAGRLALDQAQVPTGLTVVEVPVD
jgi:hypothetical protein